VSIPNHRLFHARWNNAVKIATKVNELMAKGYTVLDSGGAPVMYPIEIDTQARTVTRRHSSNCTSHMFEWKEDYDHGLYTTIKDFNDHYRTWKAFHPRDVKRIV
jgi:hypothetical protein